MRILQIHNYYQQPGGEDVVVSNEMAMLRAGGHEVVQFSVDNQEIVSAYDKISVALTVHWSNRYTKQLRKIIKDSSPDIAHVHNFFPLLSPSIFKTLKEFGLPVVQTLHNYRLICPSAYLLKDNNVCEKCVKGSLLNSILGRCYRNSAVATLPVAAMIKFNRDNRVWEKGVDRYIALTEFAKSKFIEGGLPAEKISVKPNFLFDNGPSGKKFDERHGYLFVGRISEEKGIRQLCEKWLSLESELTVVGDGPLLNELKNLYGGYINFVGRQTPEKVQNMLNSAKALIMNSKWYEGFPMVILEAFRASTPVIVPRLGSMSEIVVDSGNGIVLEECTSVALANAVSKLEDLYTWKGMSSRARHSFEYSYSDKSNLKEITALYEQCSS